MGIFTKLWRGTKVLSEEKVRKAIDAIYVFIHIDRDLQNKVTMDEVSEGLEELKRVLGL